VPSEQAGPSSPLSRVRASSWRLTPRETEVLSLVRRGLENKEIAAELHLAEQTVKVHVSALLQKFAVPNRAALAEAGATLDLTGELGVDRSWIPQFFRDAEPQICVLRGPDLRYEAANEAFMRAIGDRPVIGLTMREAFPELEGQGIYERVERVYRSGVPAIQHEQPAKWDRGKGIEERSVDLVIQPLRGDAGAVNGVVSFAVDVTEVVDGRGQSDLIADEFTAVLDLVPSGVIVVDDAGRISNVNPAAMRIARTAFDLAQPFPERGAASYWLADAFGRPLAANDTPVARALRGETLLAADFTFTAGSPAETVKVRSSARPLRAADGRIRGAILVFTEID